jgi:hypothetical protein
MRAISEESLQSCLSSGSKSRLIQFKRELARDRDKVIFDDQIVDLLKKYAINPKHVEDILNYLNNLKDSDGASFSQSRREYKKMEQSLIRFAEDNHTSFRWNHNYQKALKWIRSVVKSEFKLRQLHYESDDDIVRAVPKSTTHSGFTFILTGRKKKGDNMHDIFRRFLSIVEKAKKEGSFNRCILPGTRTQGSGAFDDVTGEFTHTCKHKTRLVSMIDLMVIIAELEFAKPFQSRMAQIEQYAGGKSDSDIRIILGDKCTKWVNWYSLDYSSFDQTISDWLIRDAFDVIKDCFIKSDFDDELFKIIVDDFIEKNFVTPNGIVHSKKGVPSGSMFTQIIDSLVNLICIATYCFSEGIQFDTMVMGDDNLLLTRDEVDINRMSTYLRKNLGLEMNPSKLKSGKCKCDYPCFLSAEWRPGGRWRHPNVLISKMAYPERWRPYAKQEVTPEMVLYAYYLTYPKGMGEFLNMGKFLSDNINLREEKMWKVASRYVPGSLSYIRDYTWTKANGGSQSLPKAG